MFSIFKRILTPTKKNASILIATSAGVIFVGSMLFFAMGELFGYGDQTWLHTLVSSWREFLTCEVPLYLVVSFFANLRVVEKINWKPKPKIVVVAIFLFSLLVSAILAVYNQ